MDRLFSSTNQPFEVDEYNLVGDVSVDIRRRPSRKSTSRQWKAAYFIMGTRHKLNFSNQCLLEFEPNFITYKS